MLQPYAVTCIRLFCSSLSEATFEATQAVMVAEPSLYRHQRFETQTDCMHMNLGLQTCTLHR